MINSINLIVIWEASWFFRIIVIWVIWVVLIILVLAWKKIFIFWSLSILSLIGLLDFFFHGSINLIIWLFNIRCWSVMYFWTFKNILLVFLFLKWLIISLCFSSELINQMDSKQVKKAIWINIFVFLYSKSKPKLSVQFLRLYCFIYKQLIYYQTLLKIAFSIRSCTNYPHSTWVYPI